MRWLVVGAGSGGCVVARRLVDAGHDVVLFEAGPPLRAGTVPPEIDGDDSFAALASPGRMHDGLTARRTRDAPVTRYLRGRGEGGSSAVNSMVALRGDPAVYDSWGWTDADGCFDRVLVPARRAAAHEVGRVARAWSVVDDRAEVAPLTRRDGRRVTAAEAYLWPVLGGLRTRPDAPVDRIEIDGSGSPVGVRLADGTVVDGDAVVMCAGAIHTPAILQRSGLDDDRVGTGLCDHPSVAFALRLRDPHGAGGLSVSVLADHDPIQFLPIDHLGTAESPDLAVLLVALMRPTSSSGTVRTVSDDPAVHPEVDFDLLRDDTDVERLADGVETAIDLLTSSPLAAIVAETFVDDVGTPLAALDAREAIVDWVRGRGADYVHAACSMSKAIDDHGRVLGCDGLYVADASAFPAIPNVNTHLPTMMLAERFVAHWIDTGR